MKIGFSVLVFYAVFTVHGPIQASDSGLTTDAVRSVMKELAPFCEHAIVWNEPLCGPTIFVEPELRGFVAANLVLGELSEAGEWPADRNIANTDVDWNGIHYAMLKWPLPENLLDRNRLILHENYHRIEGRLKFDAGPYSPANHLDSKEGRTSIRLEMYMLREAINKRTTVLRVASAKAALVFRAQRIAGPAVLASEKHLNIKEGLSEYSALAAVYPLDIDRQLLLALENADKARSLVRSFSYSTAPAWIYLLDIDFPKWRDTYDGTQDFPDIYAGLVGGTEGANLPDPSIVESVSSEEVARETETLKAVAAFTRRFVNGPIIQLPQGSFTFDPGTAVALGDHGTVYRTFGMQGQWGSFETTQGALISSDYSKVTIDYVEQSGKAILATEHWALILTEGWEIVQTADNYRIKEIGK